MNSSFNITAAVVMGAIGIGSLIVAGLTKDPALAHDICLAIVSGLTGALTGAAVAKKLLAAKADPNPQP